MRWQALKAAGAIGSIAIRNPKTVEQPWERTAPSRLNPVMTLVDPRFNDLAGMQVGASVNPASAERLFAGSPHTFAELLTIADARKPLPRFALPSSLRARVTLESSALQSDNVVARAAWKRPHARPRARRADRAPRSRRRRRGGERRPHLQRRHGQRLGHRDVDRGRAHARRQPGATEAIHSVRGGHRGRARPARVALLRRRSHRATRVDRRQHQHGHVPAALPDEVGDGAGSRRVRSRRSRARGGEGASGSASMRTRSRSGIASRGRINTASSGRASRRWR